MCFRVALAVSLIAFSLAACAPAEPPMLIEDTSSARVAGGDAPPLEMAAGSAPIGDEDDAVSR